MRVQSRTRRRDRPSDVHARIVACWSRRGCGRRRKTMTLMPRRARAARARPEIENEARDTSRAAGPSIGSAGPELPVAGVAEARQDVALVVTLAVGCGA